METSTYLGVDLSTQQLKAIVIDDNLEILHQVQVQFDNDLPEFRTHAGVIQNGSEVYTPTVMWVKALDILVERLRVAGVDLQNIAAVCGTAQQHGSVYWLKGSLQRLQTLSPSRFLHEQLANCFSVHNSPVWQDSSTTAYCKKIEESAGGSERLAEITGSIGYERFTGPQIAKVYQTKPSAYANTERISLVSSFLCSVFLGNYAPIDFSDASGMNLLDIHNKQWYTPCLNACAPDLAEKLGKPVHSQSVLGNISPYFVDRFEFSPECKIIAFTGDNPASLIGMRLSPTDVLVSLGTSDTINMWLEKPKPLPYGHVLCNPLNTDAYMALLCFKNGSLVRERIRNECAEGSWKLFNELLESTPRGNFGNMGLYFDSQEIIPFIQGDFRFNKAGSNITRFTSKELEVRALIEGQFIARRAHTEDLGFQLGKQTRILATGGASENLSILQVLADVFNAPVYIQEAINSAVLGVSYQAKLALKGGSFEEMTHNLPEPKLVCQPFKDAASIYNPMVARYRQFIQNIQKEDKFQ